MLQIRSVQELRMKYQVDNNGFVDFGDIARGEMLKQCQYASFYVLGDMPDYPDLGEGLRFQNFEEAKSNHHDLRIHVDDVPTLMKRYITYRNETLGPFA